MALRGHWPLLEGSGSVFNDVSGNGKHLTGFSPTAIEDWSPPDRGRGLFFRSGTTAFKPHGLNTNVCAWPGWATGATLSCWFRAPSTELYADYVAGAMEIVTVNGPGMVMNLVYYGSWGNNTVFIQPEMRAQYVYGDGVSLTTDRWYHLIFSCLTTNGTEARMRVGLNGTLLTDYEDFDPITITPSTLQVLIGRANSFYGVTADQTGFDLVDVKFWDNAMTASDMATEYAAVSSPTGWSFWDGSAETPISVVTEWDGSNESNLMTGISSP